MTTFSEFWYSNIEASHMSHDNIEVEHWSHTTFSEFVVEHWSRTLKSNNDDVFGILIFEHWSHTTTYVKFGSIEREEPILFIWTQNFVVWIWVVRAKSPQNLVFNTSFSRFSSLLRTRFDFQKIVMFQWVSSRKFCWKIGMLQRHRAKRGSEKKCKLGHALLPKNR